jgi:hypothetical protein
VQSLPIGGGFRVPCILISPWTQGGWVVTEKFDHTSPLRLLELLTGVKVPNLSAWRRSTFGDLTSALGVASSAAPPPLPDTKAQLEEAAKEVETLPPPTFPGKTQTPPKQETGSIPRPRVYGVRNGSGSRPSSEGGGCSGTGERVAVGPIADGDGDGTTAGVPLGDGVGVRSGVTLAEGVAAGVASWVTTGSGAGRTGTRAGWTDVPPPVLPCTVLDSGRPVNSSKAVTSPITARKTPTAAPARTYHFGHGRPGSSPVRGVPSPFPVPPPTLAGIFAAIWALPRSRKCWQTVAPAVDSTLTAPAPMRVPPTPK